MSPRKSDSPVLFLLLLEGVPFRSWYDISPSIGDIVNDSSALAGPAGELLISTFLDRVPLRVAGGVNNLLDVDAVNLSPTGLAGSSYDTSISVSASSSSVVSQGIGFFPLFLDLACCELGKSRRGVMEDPVKGRRRLGETSSGSSSMIAWSSSSESSAPCTEPPSLCKSPNFLNLYFPRLIVNC